MAVRCDHTVDEQVERLVARVRGEHGRLDVLVNNAWGGYEGHDWRTFDAPFWEQPRSQWDAPEYLGRAIAALAGDPELMRRTGETLTVGDLARTYGFTDVDGRQPGPFGAPAGGERHTVSDDHRGPAASA